MLDDTRLGQLINLWGTIEDFATAVVLIGLILEVFHEFIDGFGGNLRKKINRLAILLVAMGVAGEFCSQYQLSAYNTQLVSSLENETAMANNSANDAILKTAELGVTTRNLSSSVDDQKISAEKAIASLKVNAATIRKEEEEIDRRNIETRNRLLQSELALKKAEATAARALEHAMPRTLLFCKSFRSLADSMKPSGVEIFYSPMGTDTAFLAASIHECLEQEGWPVSIPKAISVSLNGSDSLNMLASMQAKGIVIDASPSVAREKKNPSGSMFASGTPEDNLTTALQTSLINGQMPDLYQGIEPNLQEGYIRITVWPK